MPQFLCLFLSAFFAVSLVSVVVVRAFFTALVCHVVCSAFLLQLLLLFVVIVVVLAALLALHDLLAVALPLFQPLLCKQIVNKKLLFKFACVCVCVQNMRKKFVKIYIYLCSCRSLLVQPVQIVQNSTMAIDWVPPSGLAPG